MSARTIKPAVRHGIKARLALAGPTGSGKTWTSLELARELSPQAKALVIDTERGSASKYADDFAFDVMEWAPPYDPRELTDVLKGLNGYEVVVVDSLTHFWQGEGGTLDIVDAAGQRAAGNKFVGWKLGTPAQNSMVDALLALPAHLIVTMRSKMEHVLEQDAKGKMVPRKIGLAPIQREGFEYEFDVVGDIDLEHRIAITKSRCKPLSDKVFQPGNAPEMGRVLAVWLEGAEPDPIPVVSPNKQVVAALQVMSDAEREAFRVKHKFTKGKMAAEVMALPEDVARQLIAAEVPLAPAVNGAVAAGAPA